MSGVNPSLADSVAAMNLSSTANGKDETGRAFFEHSSAQRVNTDAVIVQALTKQYPNLELIVAPAYSLDFNGFARAGHASIEPIEDHHSNLPASLHWDSYLPPSRRMDGALGYIAQSAIFAKYMYKWKNHDFIIYFVEGRDGTVPYGPSNFYILTTAKATAHQLMLEVGRWSSELHGEIWIFDSGYWQKSAGLYQSIMKSSWDAVILDAKMKKAIIEDHLSFFRSRNTYQGLKVPWKRGIIYHGPPGNGKTISIKATMKMLYNLDTPVPTLYVRTLTSYAGPEYSIKQIFSRARQFAPCYLVFEDLDAMISDDVRSYFLNEVDGLKDNDGIFMIGSTNHLDRLDPGISKRPSRFDRKYFFPDPNLDERILYCQFWRKKLSSNKDIEFPEVLCKAIAEITDKFSFAYIQEAFVAALLAIASRESDDASVTSDEWVDVLESPEPAKDLDKLILWVEIKKQIAILREGLDDE